MKLFQNMLIGLFVLILAGFAALQVYTRTMVDSTPPVISFDSDVLQVPIDSPRQALLEGVHAVDETDGDISTQVMVRGHSQLLEGDTVNVSYLVFDSSHNIATANRTVHFLNYEKPRFSLDVPLSYPRNGNMEILEILHAHDTKDGDISDSIRISLGDLTPGTPGTYTIKAQVTNSLGDYEILPLKVVILDDWEVLPTFSLTDCILYLEQGEFYRPERYLRDISNPGAVQIDSDADTSVPGVYHTRYSLQTPTERPEVYQTYTAYQTVVVR